MFGGIVFGLFLVAFVVVASKRVFTRRGRGAIGPAASGAFHDLLNKDRQNAIEIIIEERAEARDPEDKDGNLPDLSGGRRR